MEGNEGSPAMFGTVPVDPVTLVPRRMDDLVSLAEERTRRAEQIAGRPGGEREGGKR